jgi:hypothetical protein
MNDVCPLFIMIEIFRSTIYKTAEFVQLLKVFFANYPCLLCKKVHELKIHDYPTRLYRNNESYRNEKIIIPVIICLEAKKLGLPYTKRILPPFLSPNAISLWKMIMKCSNRCPQNPWTSIRHANFWEQPAKKP